MKYFYIRKALRLLSNLFRQQCSGKREIGLYGSLEWCQQRAFHDGACTNYEGLKF